MKEIRKIDTEILSPGPWDGKNSQIPFTLIGEVVYERQYEWGDDIPTTSHKIGKIFPECCSPYSKTEENGHYLCKCGRHVIHIYKESDQGKELISRKIIKLPVEIAIP